MKYVLVFSLSMILGVCNVQAQQTLSGKIKDKVTGETLVGADVYIPDLKTGTVSDTGGNYRISNLPKSKIRVEVSFVGYETILETVDLSVISRKDFIMEFAVMEMNEIVVTGLSHATERKRTPTPITLLPREQLLETTSSNIIDAIATQPGVSQVTTGNGISKPVIRGLGFNRVVVVNDGVRQEGQQWGDEHGIELDENSVNKVEILKGPASLAYGSDAMAGVINMISFPTLPDSTILGNVFGNYQSNNGQIGYSASLAGNSKGFIWDVRYSGKKAHAYRNKYDGYVYGSGFNENAFSTVTGINKSWGYSHLHLSVYQMIPGIVEGERDSVSGKFIKGILRNDSTVTDSIVSDKDLKSYTTGIPHQDIRHNKAVLNNNFVFTSGSLKTIFGFQQNQRREFGNVADPGRYGLYFLLNTLTYDVRFIFPDIKKWQLASGINGMRQVSQNKGNEFLVPEYSLFDFGTFFTAKRFSEKTDISGGIRYDNRNIHSGELLLDSLGKPVEAGTPYAVRRFSEFDKSLSGLSGSLGITWQISHQFFTKLNLSRGFRAPNISELGSNGIHEGTGRYETGNTSLKPESSLQLDFAAGVESKHVSAEADLFYNSIGNYIYSRKLTAVSGGDSIADPVDPAPVFQFVQGNAVVYGGELLIDIHPHPLDWLHFENAFSVVWGTLQNATDSTRNLPLIPAPKFSSDLRANLNEPASWLNKAYVKFSIEHYFPQENIYSAYATETATPGYTLFGFGAGTDFIRKERTVCSFYISVSNLTDVAYQNHLSRLKYAPENYASGRRGVYNMGRNISFKFIIPLYIRN